MIRIEHVTKKYGDLTVYRDFSLDIGENEITCLLGPSGCGKTTLLNMLAGIGEYAGSISPECRCSYIFQEPRLVPNLTVEGNLRLVCPESERVRDMIRRVGLSGKEKSFPSQLSGGQAQRVSIARAFLHSSELILMDEPFSSLDTALKLNMIELFCSLWRAERRTAVYVTHDAEEAYIFSHRAVILSAGRIIADIAGDGEVPRPYGEPSAYRREILDRLLAGDVGGRCPADPDLWKTEP